MKKFKFRVNHNGHQVDFIEDDFKSGDKVDAFIQSKLNKDLNPVKIFDFQRRNIYVEVYEYDNEEQEVFVVTILD